MVRSPTTRCRSWRCGRGCCSMWLPRASPRAMPRRRRTLAGLHRRRARRAGPSALPVSRPDLPALDHEDARRGRRCARARRRDRAPGRYPADSARCVLAGTPSSGASPQRVEHGSRCSLGRARNPNPGAPARFAPRRAGPPRGTRPRLSAPRISTSCPLAARRARLGARVAQTAEVGRLRAEASVIRRVPEVDEQDERTRGLLQRIDLRRAVLEVEAVGLDPAQLSRQDRSVKIGGQPTAASIDPAG